MLRPMMTSVLALSLTACATTGERTGTASATADIVQGTGTAPNPAPLAQLVDEVQIPYQKFTLANGLDVIVHEDRKAPIVGVAVWYKVGSKDEPKGKTGFAHLFEHLMFNGSENAPEDFFEYLQQMGATDYNGTTNFDRTNYFQTVPRGALEKALWLESDRMGYLLGAVTQAKLDNQRGVVQNEKRQGDNQPAVSCSTKWPARSSPRRTRITTRRSAPWPISTPRAWRMCAAGSVQLRSEQRDAGAGRRHQRRRARPWSRSTSAK
jgi:hypothetical protein